MAWKQDSSKQVGVDITTSEGFAQITTVSTDKSSALRGERVSVTTRVKNTGGEAGFSEDIVVIVGLFDWTTGAPIDTFEKSYGLIKGQESSDLVYTATIPADYAGTKIRAAALGYHWE